MMRVIGANQTIFPEVDIFVAVTTGVLTLMGVVANGLVLVAIATQKRLHKRANALLFSLALLDFLTCALNGPYSIITFYTTIPWPSFTVCRGMLTYGIASSLTSCLFSALISVNGLCGIMSKRESATWNQILVVAMTVTGWLVFISVSLIPLFFIHGFTFQPRLGVCYVNESDETLRFTIAVFSITALSWLISLICYVKIVNIVRISNKRVAGASNDDTVPPVNRINARNRHLINLVQTVFITFLFYIVFFIPILIVEMLYRADFEPHYLIYRTVCLFLWSSSAMNPFIYMYRLKDIREAITKFVLRISNGLCARFTTYD